MLLIFVTRYRYQFKQITYQVILPRYFDNCDRATKAILHKRAEYNIDLHWLYDYVQAWMFGSGARYAIHTAVAVQWGIQCY